VRLGLNGGQREDQIVIHELRTKRLKPVIYQAGAKLWKKLSRIIAIIMG
jgi:hypothetical protein